MKIINTINEIDICFENGMFSKSGWDTYIEKVYPAAKKLVEADSASYHFERDILPVVNMVCANKDKLRLLNESFKKITDKIEEKIADTVGTTIDADIVLYLGLCNGAGWATKVENRSVVLLGIEKIIELGWTDELSMIGLVYHELGHLWHFQNRTVRTEIKTPVDGALWQLYSEGIAMYFEQMLCGDAHFYHQDKNGWLNWCMDNRKRLFGEYLRRIDAGESVQDFFGDWCSFEGKSDVGYYLGAELICDALKAYSRNEVLNLSVDDVKDILINCAK